MDSPINVGDTTTNSILHRLQDTHIEPSVTKTKISSAVYDGQQVLQLTVTFKNINPDNEDIILNNADSNRLTPTPGSKKKDSNLENVIVLRRLQDSFVNISQLFNVLVCLDKLKEDQVDKYLDNEVISNPQFSSQKEFVDYRKHTVENIRGIWIAYDKAVSLALKFDIYEIAKKLFLVDVHDFDKLPTTMDNTASISGKRTLYDDEKGTENSGSPSKKQKVLKEQTSSDRKLIETSNYDILQPIIAANSYAPYTIPPITEAHEVNGDLLSDLKLKFGKIFKKDDDKNTQLSYEDIKQEFSSVLPKDGNIAAFSIADISLDQQGKTALHFAATLASTNLVSSFIKLGLCLPLRGTIEGESVLISTISVTNSMEKSNFYQLLNDWLWPCLLLLDKKKWSILHYLASQLSKQSEASTYYFNTILEWSTTLKSNHSKVIFSKLCLELVNLQDKDHQNTALHIAAEHQNKWFITVLIELGADPKLANGTGLKPLDYDIVKEVIYERENNSFKFQTEKDSYIFELISMNASIARKQAELGIVQEFDDELTLQTVKNEPQVNGNIDSGANKIFQSIQNLLNGTKTEYQSVIKLKKEQLQELNLKLHDSSIITSNNRYISKKIAEKLVNLDTLKLQIANINDRLEITKREIPEKLLEDEDDDNQTKYDADEPFRIQEIYDQIQRGVELDKIEVSVETLNKMPLLSVLQARLAAYKEVNSKTEQELQSLSDYAELTSKFKKVVSFCTGVDINEVDELLEGLLEAVESQQ